MDCVKMRALKGFYEFELSNNILPFWLNKSVDHKYGGFFSCFDNHGQRLISTDKYTWSQGRFVWLFSKLYSMKSDTFTKEQKDYFLKLAENGKDYILKHCLIAPEVWRCVYLTEQDGTPKKVPGYDRYDCSYTIDSFVVVGLAGYAAAAKDEKTYQAAKMLYLSFLNRVDSERPTLPYTWSEDFLFQGTYQNINWLSAEIYKAAEIFDPDFCGEIKQILKKSCREMADYFVDQAFHFREMVFADGRTDESNMLVNHMNPGHAVINMYYLVQAAQILNVQEYIDLADAVVLRTLQTGWDSEYGGYYHFCGMDGGKPSENVNGYEKEFFTKMVLSDWSDKLWWVEAECLRAAVRCYERTGNLQYLQYHDRLFDYVFQTFPNEDRDIREWIQIRARRGEPVEKVTAVPVKDPFHISRSLILIIESIGRMLSKDSVSQVV